MSTSPELELTGLEAAEKTTPPAPFLRWAGGKRWLVPQILRLLNGRAIGRYHEPFLGGGSIFFGLTATAEVHLSDLNSDLIEVYQTVKERPREVASRLSSYQNTADDYYIARAAKPLDQTDRAARFIYLNHTSYNGIFRVNLKGEYNVPFGNRKSISMPDEESLVRVAHHLSNASLAASDFGSALTHVQAGDLVFLDPPYTVAHNNNGFVKYNQQLFSFDDQERLAHEIERISGLGAKYILTNAAHSSIEKLFSPLGERVTVSRRNVIGGKKASRGRADEYLFTNIGVL